MLIALSAPRAGPLKLHLTWGGRPRLPPLGEHEYPLGWGFQGVATPQAVRALLVDGVGYLLRDGDWHPWPWTSRSRQAESSQVTLRVTNSSSLVPASRRGGWEGELPAALLVIPPGDDYQAAGRTVHVGPLAGEQLNERLGTFAELLPALWKALGETRPPAHIVALPYLYDFVWSDDLLLVPEGNGYISSEWVEPAYYPGATPAIVERAILTGLARAWLAGHLPVPRTYIWVQPRYQRWSDHPGRWIEPIDFGHMSRSSRYTRESVEITPVGQSDALALWISVELADPVVRQALLDLFQPGVAQDRQKTRSERLEQYLPYDVEVSQGEREAIIQALYGWAAEVGTERALHLVGDAVRARRGELFDLEQLFADLERVSGVPLLERWQAFQSK